jgi:hypothetical protein
MRYYQTDLQLIVVDFESIAKEIEVNYLNKLRGEFQVFSEDLPKRDAERLLIYYILQSVFQIELKFKVYKKNLIYYINKKSENYNSIRTSFIHIAKALNLIVYTDTLDYNCINSKSGEHVELINNITNFRFNFDHSKFSSKKITNYLKKHKLSPDILNQFKQQGLPGDI